MCQVDFGSRCVIFPTTITFSIDGIVVSFFVIIPRGKYGDLIESSLVTAVYCAFCECHAGGDA